jgi:hypothetical protein
LPFVGDKIGWRELQARWAYSELLSARFISMYSQFAEFAGLFKKARTAVPFEALNEDETYYLFVMNDLVRSPLVWELKQVPTFVCESWTKEQIGRALTIYKDNDGNPIPFERFAGSCPFVVGQGLDPSDPRVAALLIPDYRVIPQKEAVPLVPVGDGRLKLLDGYLRSLLFWRSSDRDSHLFVWVPLTESPST